MTARALRFGDVAAAYERYRLGYPDDVVDLVMSYAGRPLRTALEIGAGTGKATRVFTRSGVAVTASEPDPAMLDQLRARVPGAATVQATFEALPPDGRYELVYSAAALHWTRPEGRWSRVAALLEPDGVFANMGGPVRLADPALERAVEEARAPYLETDEIGTPDGTPPEAGLQWPGTELQQSALFTDVEQVVVERRLALPADVYVGYLSTVSAYLELPVDQQRQVLEGIRRALPATVEVSADVTVHLARRAGT
jgi:SAM-dependent methyltransferase